MSRAGGKVPGRSRFGDPPRDTSDPQTRANRRDENNGKSRFGARDEPEDEPRRDSRPTPAGRKSIPLHELCEPLFQYICLLNRSAGSEAITFEQARRDVTDLLKQFSERARNDATLFAQVERIERPLVFFIDFIIASSRLPFAAQWQETRLAHELSPAVLVGDSEFFVLLDQTLTDKTPAATERLVIFYTCMGLGFSGEYTGQPEYLRRKMQECATRIRDVMQQGRGKICEDAYDHVDTRDLIERPARSLTGFGIALGLMAVVLFAANVVLYYTASDDLNKALRQIIDPRSMPTEKPGANGEVK